MSKNQLSRPYHGLRVARIFFMAAGMGVSLTVAADNSTAANASKNKTYPEAYVARNVPVAVRDGTRLATDVYLPGKNGHVAAGQFPTLVDRTPYGKSGYQSSGIFFARHGYAVVIQDVRGLNNSQGKFYPYINEAKDSYDTVEWAGKQSWSTGKVGTFGVSYMAGTQLLMVHNKKLPPHLVTMAPGYASSSYYGDGAYVGGAFRSSHNLDYETSFAVEQYDKHHGTAGQVTPIKRAKEALDQLYWRIPVKPFKPLLKAGFPVLDDYMAHYTYDKYWSKLNDQPFYHKLNLPVLNYSGWYDLFDQGTIQNYEGIKHKSQSATQLVMGPYEHDNQDVRAQGMMSGEPKLFPKNSTYVKDELNLAWFDQYLKRQKVFGSTPSVRLYIPGAGFDQWVGADNFPFKKTQQTDYYLHSHGKASIGNININNLNYDGSLSTKPPAAKEPADHYTYNPRDPVVTIEGYDQHWAGGVNEETEMYQHHKDILVYETPLLKHDTAIVGPITVTLYASTSGKTTDFMVNLTDVDPTGHNMFVAEGARRGGIGNVSSNPRNPKSYAKVVPLVPGKIYKWKISVWPTGRVFAKNHRIRIDITSSDFPHYSRNLNTSPELTATKVALAHQTVYHTSKYPSHVTLPIVPMTTMKNSVISGPTPPGYPKNGDAIYTAAQNAPSNPPGQDNVVTKQSSKPNWVLISK